ncbi:TBC1 domain family member 17 [Portunus trituberculatus]|uniref:TBC1 domain family member 17 n=1 Tax=Portunus trituberculatus TaxID=210409 RepID=A0A5B7ERU8_PORTR|nr:TBC1 domain family member 17 [Portunus trituberculatus]
MRTHTTGPSLGGVYWRDTRRPMPRPPQKILGAAYPGDELSSRAGISTTPYPIYKVFHLRIYSHVSMTHVGPELLVYEQDEVYTIPTSSDELKVGGRLRIIEKPHGVVLEWRCTDDEASTDSDWAVINSAAVTFTHHNISDSVEISTPRRNVRPISIELIDLRSYRLGQDGSLVLIQRDGTTHPALAFHSGSVLCFVEVLLRYVAVKKSEKDCNLYLVSDKKQAAQDEELLAMNLVPSRQGPSAARGAHSFPTTHQRVWGFFNNFKRDPYTTTAGALSKFYDAVCKLVLE